MALPLKISFSQLDESPSSSKATFGESPERVWESDKEGEDSVRPMTNLMPHVNVEHGNLHDLMSAQAWRNHVIWRAGVSTVAISLALTMS